jgi:transcriptional regulator with XRE-family HTH domain
MSFAYLRHCVYARHDVCHGWCAFAQYGALVNWPEYVGRHMDGRTQYEVAGLVGVSPPALSRWLRGQQGVDAAVAIRFAKAVGDSPLAALVAAGYLTPEEASEQPAAAPDYSQLTNDELLQLVRQRMGEHHATATSRPGESPGEPSRADRLNAAAEGLLASVPEEAAEQARLAKRAMQDRAERTLKQQP